MLNDITVLITAAGNVFMPGTTACLRNNGERHVRLIGADMNEDPTILQMCDAYYKVPRGDDPSYVKVLLEICKREHVDIVLPIMSVELNAIAANRKSFEDIGTTVSVSNLDALKIANDKLQLFDYMVGNGIPCAQYYAVHSIKEMEDAAHNLGYPQKRVCVKAVNGSGSRGFRILEENLSHFERFMHEKPSSCFITLSDMKRILIEAVTFPEIMLMEYLPGDEYTVDLVANKGEILYVGCRKSLGMDNSIMLDGVVVENLQVTDLCKKVAESLKLDGNIGFDLKENEDGTPYIMECNPRITAGIPVFAAAGINLPYLNVKRLLGERLPDCKPQIGLKVKRRWQEMYMTT